MSYSFTLQRPTKPELKLAVTAAFDEAVEAERLFPEHRAAHESAVQAMVDTLDDPDDREVYVSVTGARWDHEGAVHAMQLRIDANCAAP